MLSRDKYNMNAKNCSFFRRPIDFLSFSVMTIQCCAVLRISYLVIPGSLRGVGNHRRSCMPAAPGVLLERCFTLGLMERKEFTGTWRPAYRTRHTSLIQVSHPFCVSVVPVTAVARFYLQKMGQILWHKINTSEQLFS